MQQEQIILPRGITVRDPSGERYVIEGLLGEGGSGAVYLVRDRRVKQLFALKEVIDPDQHERARFAFEGQVLQRLSHRALPRVYRVFEHDKLKRVYLLMDYIEGQDLAALQKEQRPERFALSLVLVLLEPIVDALSYLHHQDPPIVHRDIKPSNIIVPTGGDGAMLVDFGIAKEYVLDSTTTVIRHGSPGYAAPEQYGHGTTPRTDIYGLGATLYTLLTGTVPPDSITRATAPRGLDPLEPAHMLAPDVPLGVTTAIERAMRISRDDRFETIEQFWQEVTACAPGQQVWRPSLASLALLPSLPAPGHTVVRTTPALSPHQRHTPLVRRGRTLLFLALALLLSITIGAGLFAAFARQSSPPATMHRVTTAGPTLAPPTMTHKPSFYPNLAASYAGTVVDLLNNEKTPLFLTNIQQSQGNIRGFFQGLGLVGPFTGTVTHIGHVQFTVTVHSSGDEVLAFEGDIKIGGDMVGSFTALDRNGYRTGESGIWNVATSR